MEHLSNLWNEHLELIDQYININSFSAKNLQEWFVPLIHSITEDGAVPYLLNDSERFRASPLSSTIIWLDSEHLIPFEILNKMQDMLIFLKDNNRPEDRGTINMSKKEDDTDGWSLGEGVSVWSTSLAIIALLDKCGNGLKKVDKFKASVLWLAEQCNINEDGWAYQKWTNCAVNPVMTSLALRALALTLSKQNRIVFNFTSDEERQILISIKSGLDYLKNTCQQRKGMVFWCFNNVPHCAATTWTLLALHQITLIEGDIGQDCRKYYKNQADGALAFVLSKMPNKIEKWPDEPIVHEAGAKYSKQKNYFSYSATLLPQLFSLGLSPYHYKVINQIKWILKNPEEWKIHAYDKSKTCTFTYAMVLTILTSWSKRIGSEFALELISEDDKMDKIIQTLTGFRLLKKQTFLLVSKNRLWLYIGLTVFLVIVILFGSFIHAQIYQLTMRATEMWEVTANDRYNIFINVISAGITGGLAYLITFFLKLLRRYFK